MAKPRDVLIVGASGRAAAQSAVRAGWRPWVVDLFGDEDLIEASYRHRSICNYRELPAAIADWPRMPWLFTGAVENHPALVRKLCEIAPLWGSPPEAIRQVRKPQRLADVLNAAGCPGLGVWPNETPPPADGKWMLKPARTAGGQGIFVWDEKNAASPAVQTALKKKHIFQERANGEAASAVFLSAAEQVTLIGMSRLFPPNVPASPFGYGGAIGPITLPVAVESQVLRQGAAVGKGFGLRGLWGMDLIHDGSRVWPTEVNPRYTATVELYEHAYDMALLALHRSACDATSGNTTPPCPPHPSPLALGERGQHVSKSERPIRRACVGKVVVYADSDLTIPAWDDWPTARDAFLPNLPCLADRPKSGSRVLRGHPVCSLLAAGASESECREELDNRLLELQCHFRVAGVEISVRLNKS